MTPKKLINQLCVREGLKKQVNIAQVTDLVGHLADIIHSMKRGEEETLLDSLWFLGEKRAKAKAKK
jgi:cAMP phosphodiesterase